MTEGRCQKQEEGSVSFGSRTQVCREVTVIILCQLLFVYFKLKFNLFTTSKAVHGFG